MITRILPAETTGRWRIVGSACDNGEIRRVVVNGRDAVATRPNFGEWEIEIDGGPGGKISAHAVDAAGNVEPSPHVLQHDEQPKKLAGIGGK